MKFADLIGGWQHFSVPLHKVTAIHSARVSVSTARASGDFRRSTRAISCLIPDLNTAIVDPVCKVPTLSILGNIKDPITGEWYTRDPRYIAQKAEKYLDCLGIATTSYWGPEAEFFLFNDISLRSEPATAATTMSTPTKASGTRANGKANLGYRPRTKEGYFPVPPLDRQQDVRSAMVLKMIEAGDRRRASPPRSGDRWPG